MAPETLLDTKATAEYLGLAEITLAKMRGKGTGPKFIRVTSKAVRYRFSDIDSWLARSQHTSTAEYHAA